MNDKSRQEILKELKFLLTEQEEPSESGYFSEDVDDIIEDINDANKISKAGIEYIDLTTMEDSTDEGELTKFLNSFNGIPWSELKDKDAKGAISKICNNIVLINSFGPTDTYFQINCKPTAEGMKYSAVKLGVEGEEATFTSKKKYPTNNNVSATTKQPAEEPYKQVAAGKFSFSCRDSVAVGLYQQFLGVPVDCKVGRKTISAQVAKTGNKISLEEYFGEPPTAQQLANQKLFCDSIIKDVPNLKAAIVKAGGTPITKCSVAGSATQKRATSTAKANTFEKSLQQIKAKKIAAIKPSENRDEKMKEIEAWVQAQRDAQASNVSNPTNISKIKESNDYHEKLKINKANLLFEKLMKGQ